MFDDHATEFKAPDATRHENYKTSDSGRCNNGYPLAMAKDREKLVIRSMHGGRTYRRQLMDMGLRPGMQISVLRGGRGGPVLISVGDTRLGIGRGMAEKIEVVPVSEAGSL
jgi:ferrous iron transport protein A